jgi:hypothetical protein
LNTEFKFKAAKNHICGVAEDSLVMGYDNRQSDFSVLREVSSLKKLQSKYLSVFLFWWNNLSLSGTFLKVSVYDSRKIKIL